MGVEGREGHNLRFVIQLNSLSTSAWVYVHIRTGTGTSGRFLVHTPAEPRSIWRAPEFECFLRAIQSPFIPAPCVSTIVFTTIFFFKIISVAFLFTLYLYLPLVRSAPFACLPFPFQSLICLLRFFKLFNLIRRLIFEKFSRTHAEQADAHSTVDTTMPFTFILVPLDAANSTWNNDHTSNSARKLA